MALRNKMGLVLTLFAMAVVHATAIIHNLGDDTFDKFVDNLPQDALLMVDFYRPGCRHCQRLSPVLDFLEATWEGEEPDPSLRWFKLAKVDCEKSPRLASVFGIRGIPDLRFVRAGIWGTYEGGRTIEDIAEFKERMRLPPLRPVNGQELLELASEREAVFVVSAEDGVDPATASPGVLHAATATQHSATFCTASREVLSSLGLGTSESPALIKVVAGPQDQGGVLRAAQFEGDVAAVSAWTVSTWVQKESFSLVSEFTADNFTRLGSLGRLLVLGIINPKDKATPEFKRELATLASGFGLKHADKFIFGTVDGVKMAGFAETFNIYENLPRLVVLDMTTDVFYTVESLRLERVDMEAFLIDVMTGDIAGQTSSVDSTRYLMKILWAIRQGGVWSLLLLVPLVALVLVFCDSPAREEAREASRRARLAEKTAAQRLKSD